MVSVTDCYFEMGPYSDSMDSLIRYGTLLDQPTAQRNIDSGSGNSLTVLRNTMVNHSAPNWWSSQSAYIKAVYANTPALPPGGRRISLSQ